jgi:hypothetical protein
MHKLESPRASRCAAAPRYAPDSGRIKICVVRCDSETRYDLHKKDVNTHRQHAPKAGMPAMQRIVPGNC